MFFYYFMGLVFFPTGACVRARTRLCAAEKRIECTSEGRVQQCMHC
jgi:hypothetical protein